MASGNETGVLIIFFILNLGMSFVVGAIADVKNRHFGGYFALAFFFGFLIPLIVVWALPKIPEIKTGGKIASGDLVRCPHCAEPIFAEAKVCKHCGRDVEPQVTTA